MRPRSASVATGIRGVTASVATGIRGVTASVAIGIIGVTTVAIMGVTTTIAGVPALPVIPMSLNHMPTHVWRHGYQHGTIIIITRIRLPLLCVCGCGSGD